MVHCITSWVTIFAGVFRFHAGHHIIWALLIKISLLQRQTVFVVVSGPCAGYKVTVLTLTPFQQPQPGCSMSDTDLLDIADRETDPDEASPDGGTSPDCEEQKRIQA